VVFSGLRLENYRGFGQYRLSGLARVNLLVGKNNCGKTSILEAVQILASQGDPRILSNIAMQRGEMIAGGEEEKSLYPDISHLFHGHHFDLNAHFRITSGPDSGGVGVRLVGLADLDEQQQFLFDEPAIDRRLAARRVALTGPGEVVAVAIEGRPDRPSPLALPVTQEGALLLERGRIGRLGSRRLDDVTSILSITPESLESIMMGRMWNRLISESREDEVVQSLKIVEPGLASIFFVNDEVVHGSKRSKFLVGFEDPKRKRVPLGSFGEGMRRLLALSLSLNQAQGGILLVDEIDTGLHYSILGEMWLLLVKAAIQHDLQVFATTHSLDCIRGLAWLCENHPELAGEVSLQKIDGRLDEAVALDSKQIRIAVEQDLEVR